MWNSFKDEIISTVGDLQIKYPTASILVLGHSMGAALATVAAYDLKIAFPDPKMKMYNMGCPRVGNTPFYEKFKEMFDGYDYRIVHTSDTVPHLTNRYQPVDYHHT